MDWNDLQLMAGRDEVSRQLNAAIEAAEHRAEPAPLPVLGDELPPVESYHEVSSVDNKPLPPLWGRMDRAEKINYCLENFVFLYKSTNVFDRRACCELSASAFEKGVGKAVADGWYEHPGRKNIYRDNLIFDPQGLADPRTTINIFTGLSCKPKPGDVTDLLDLLLHLCGDNVEAFNWVLNWIAYPLQNVGAKMRTSIVIHGREGGGKNLFWSVVQKIYGKYATIITQNELESSFNGWASGKLFIIGNEVVSRQEMFHKKGIIKNLITEPELQINEKNIPTRKEENHANMVFFSNFLQPVTPDRDDRRFLILWTPPKLQKAFYKQVADLIHHGEGAERFLYFLLNRDLGDFDEYTEPPMTKAKADLIELSMTSSEKFLTEWVDGDIHGLPCMVAHIDDLYKAYRFWCDASGVRFKVPRDELSITADKFESLERRRSQKYAVGDDIRKGTFIVPEGTGAPESVLMKDWLRDCKTEFAGKVEDFAETIK